jgi:hypothetical protein
VLVVCNHRIQYRIKKGDAVSKSASAAAKPLKSLSLAPKKLISLSSADIDSLIDAATINFDADHLKKLFEEGPPRVQTLSIKSPRKSGSFVSVSGGVGSPAPIITEEGVPTPMSHLDMIGWAMASNSHADRAGSKREIPEFPTTVPTSPRVDVADIFRTLTEPNTVDWMGDLVYRQANPLQVVGKRVA